ncbi:MAG TPA: SDR family oxidoreductase [Thermoplasmata archaeon]|nr:SDR family oxidoreductase [Thermoplasmata archaeon]
MRLEGRSAVITGAGRGIGRAVAERFASEGARVALLARTKKELEETRAAIRDRKGEPVVVPCDLTDAGQIEEAARTCVTALRTIDVLVNNAGIYEGLGRAVRATVEDFDRTMAVNVRGPWLLVKHLAPHMPRDGSIINVTSGLARGPASGYFPYSLSKWALEGLSAQLAAELPQRVNVVNPGLVATKMSGFAGKKPDQVTEVFVYLASDESRGVTGRVLAASDGRNRATH